MPPTTRNNPTATSAPAPASSHIPRRAVDPAKEYDTIALTGNDRCQRCRDDDAEVCEIRLEKQPPGKALRDRVTACMKCREFGACSFVNATVVGGEYGQAAVDGLEKARRKVWELLPPRARQEAEITLEQVLEAESMSDDSDEELLYNAELDLSPEAIDADLAMAEEYGRLASAGMRMSGMLDPHLWGESKERRIERHLLAGELEPIGSDEMPRPPKPHKPRRGKGRRIGLWRKGG